MANLWGPGAWAAEAERAEAEAESFPNLREPERAPVANDSGAESFPSLREAAAVGLKPKKKNKGQTLTLSELATGVNARPGGRSRGGGPAAASVSQGLTMEELMTLPTGPRERSAEESDYGGPGRLGGGFRQYGRKEGGSGAAGGGGGFRDEGDGQWGSNRRPSGGGFQNDRKPQTRVTNFEPSRADEVDNWATAKKVAPPPPVNSFNRSSRERCDAEQWGSRRAEGFGSSYRDRNRERPRIVLDPPSRPRNDSLPSSLLSDAAEVDAPKPKPKANPFGLAQAREEVLAKRGEDWKNLDSEIENRSSSCPTSAHSSRPQSTSLNDPPGQPRNDSLPSSLLSDVAQVDTPKPKPKANPFGLARPREEVLAKRGEDWKKVDSEIESRSSSCPTSAHSSRPQSTSLNDPPGLPRNDSLPSSLLSDIAQVDAPKPKPKANPFGLARPREEVLAKRGEDWKKVDSEIESRSSSRPTSAHSSRKIDIELEHSGV